MAARSELTSVADDEAVVHIEGAARVYGDLTPGTDYAYDGHEFRTFADLGERLATVATVNDVHFGETICGILESYDDGPTFSSEPGDDPYPEVMNRSVIADIAAIAPDAVVAKGDLTTHGIQEEYDAFLAHYGTAFGDRLLHVRGNHDAYAGETFAADAPVARVLPGVVLAVLDTVIPTDTPGQVTADQLEWLDDLAATADRPVLVFGHHHVWSPDSQSPSGRLLRDQPRRLRAPGRGRGPPSRHRRLLRRPHPSEPGPADPRHGHRPVGRGGVREGLPRGLGRVPGVRTGHPAGPPPGVGA